MNTSEYYKVTKNYKYIPSYLPTENFFLVDPCSQVKVNSYFKLDKVDLGNTLQMHSNPSKPIEIKVDINNTQSHLEFLRKDIIDKVYNTKSKHTPPIKVNLKKRISPIRIDTDTSNPIIKLSQYNIDNFNSFKISNSHVKYEPLKTMRGLAFKNKHLREQLGKKESFGGVREKEVKVIGESYIQLQKRISKFYKRDRINTRSYINKNHYKPSVWTIEKDKNNGNDEKVKEVKLGSITYGKGYLKKIRGINNIEFNYDNTG